MSIQRYVSNELTHFVGRRLGRQPDAEQSQYQMLVSILRSGRLGAEGDVAVRRSTGQRFSDNEYYKSNMVCFSDIPVADLAIHMGKFSRFGLAFSKAFLIGRGANPVFYVASNSTARLAHGQSMERAEYFDEWHEKIWDYFQEAEQAHAAGGGKTTREIRRLLGFLVYHFFNFVKFYDEGLPADHPENYYMEREWRIFGNLVFGLGDVRRVIFPVHFARRFRDDLPDYFGEIIFS
jgi:hypothetical protein